jgi:peptidoglycan/xylan/chitin deacetylase (PgdA/CDA1 family)
MDYLERKQYSVIPLAQLARSLRQKDFLPKKSVVVTFDDGSSCTYEQAMPILADHGFPATVFMISGLVNRSNEWLLGRGFPERRMLNALELRALNEQGIEVGSHTVTHPWLSRIPVDRARAEIRDSKAQLEDLVGREVDHFAYPYGDYSAAVRECVWETGYTVACSTRWGKRHTVEDIFALRRVEITGQDSLVQFALKLRIATHNMPPLPETRCFLRQGLERLGLLGERHADRG